MYTESQFKQSLKTLGIDSAAVNIYLELVKVGHCSALQLSKLTNISRTQVYRHLGTLQHHNLVSAESLSYGTIYRALKIDNLEATLSARESETAQVRQSLSQMADFLRLTAGSSKSEQQAKVRHYYGVAGLKQANWNLLKSKEYRVFEAAHLSEHIQDKAFVRRHRERCNELQITSYDLTNKPSVKSKDIEPFDPQRGFIRSISPDVLRIDFEIYIYNKVVTLLEYGKGHQFAIEVEHPILNGMMRQLFEAMWAQATPIVVKR